MGFELRREPLQDHAQRKRPDDADEVARDLNFQSGPTTRSCGVDTASCLLRPEAISQGTTWTEFIGAIGTQPALDQGCRRKVNAKARSRTTPRTSIRTVEKPAEKSSRVGMGGGGLAFSVDLPGTGSLSKSVQNTVKASEGILLQHRVDGRFW